MPVYQLKSEMPYDEMLTWIEFFKRRPIGWREDQRAYMLLRAQGVKESAESIFPTLRMISEANERDIINDRAVPKGKVLEMMLKAKNGDSSNWKPNFGGENVSKD
jgi:hypothetical protein